MMISKIQKNIKINPNRAKPEQVLRGWNTEAETYAGLGNLDRFKVIMRNGMEMSPKSIYTGDTEVDVYETESSVYERLTTQTKKIAVSVDDNKDKATATVFDKNGQ